MEQWLPKQGEVVAVCHSKEKTVLAFACDVEQIVFWFYCYPLVFKHYADGLPVLNVRAIYNSDAGLDQEFGTTSFFDSIQN